MGYPWALGRNVHEVIARGKPRPFAHCSKARSRGQDQDGEAREAREAHGAWLQNWILSISINMHDVGMYSIDVYIYIYSIYKL